jgi:hypothetical protein
MPVWAEQLLSKGELTARPALRWVKIVDRIPLPTNVNALAYHLYIAADGHKACESWTSVAKWCVRLRASRATIYHFLSVLEELGLIVFTGRRKGLGGTKVYALAWPPTADVLNEAFVDAVIAPLAEMRRGEVVSPVRQVSEPKLSHESTEVVSRDDRSCLTGETGGVLWSGSLRESGAGADDFEVSVEFTESWCTAHARSLLSRTEHKGTDLVVELESRIRELIISYGLEPVASAQAAFLQKNHKFDWPSKAAEHIGNVARQFGDQALGATGSTTQPDPDCPRCSGQRWVRDEHGDYVTDDNGGLITCFDCFPWAV